MNRGNSTSAAFFEALHQGPPPVIVHGYAGRNFAQKISESTGWEIAELETLQHTDSEIEPRLGSNLQGRRVLYVGSASGEPNKQLFESQTIIETIHEGGAEEIMGLFPYLQYNRGDKKGGLRRPITASIAIRNISQHLHHAIVITPHNADLTFTEFSRAPSMSRCLTPNLSFIYGRQLKSFYDSGVLDPHKTLFANIDAGGAKRNHAAFKEGLLAGLGEYAEIVTNGVGVEEWMWVNLEKLRSRTTNDTTGSGPDTSVEGMDVFAIEDMIASGSSGNKAGHKIMEAGARSANVIAAHALWTSKPGKKSVSAIEAAHEGPLSLILTANTYDHSTTDTKRHKAISESDIVYEMDVAAFTGLYAEVLFTKPTLEHIEEAKETGRDRTSPSAIDNGTHPALDERDIFQPVELSKNNPLVKMAKAEKPPKADAAPPPEAAAG